MAHQSTRKRAAVKPTKPYPSFPLFPHATRRWAKKIKGKTHYFGPWDSPEAALQRYLDQRVDLEAGRTPRTAPTGLTVADLANRFMGAKRALVGTGELAERTWVDYFTVCRRLVECFGKTRPVDDLAASDFAGLRADFARTRGPVSLCNDITRVRCVFKFAYDERLIDQPARFGASFARPSRKTIRKARQAAGPKMFTAPEIRAMLKKAGQPLRTMILLAINCGFGNSDCGTLPRKALNLTTGWIDYPRPKTAVARRCPLWLETVTALQDALANRPKPKDKADAGLVFITKRGLPWAKRVADNPVSKEMRKLLDSLGIDGKRAFYAIRHTFQTIGDEARDPVAVRHIMGHAESGSDMSAVYREAVSDARLVAVVEHVRRWLYGEEAT